MKNTKIKTTSLIIVLFVLFWTMISMRISLFPFGQILFPVSAKIMCNSSEIAGAKLFRMKNKINGESVNNYVIWIPKLRNKEDREIYIIDKKNNLVGLPNFSPRDYKLLFNFLLFQKNGSDWFVPFSDGVKGPDFNSKLEILKNKITFETPDKEYSDYPKINIILE